MRTILALCGAALLAPLQTVFSQTFSLETTAAGLEAARHTNGVAVADYDQDGDLDVYIVASNQYDPEDPMTWNRLFQNQGQGHFVDVALEAGVRSTLNGQTRGGMGFKFGAAWGDYDNDGFPDLFLTNLGPDELYHNNGDGTFTEVTAEAGVVGRDGDHNSSAVWWDYDLDGDLDLYVSAWIGENIFYENQGDGTFLDVTTSSALGDTGQTWTAIPIDANNDGWLDLYVVNDFGANRFYVNQGDKTFREATAEFGLEDEGHGMGVTVGDYNNDGYFDIYLTNISDSYRCPLFVNTGNGRFVNRAAEAGVDDTGWAWGTEFFDCDHDGDVELYVVNGFKIDPGHNFFFDNTLMETGVARYVDVSSISGTDGEYEARGLVVFDHDNDGDLDLLVANWWDPPYLYANQTRTHNWLKVKLRGTVSNRFGVGATVTVRIGEQALHRANDGVEFLGQSIQPVHFGVGNAEVVDEIRVRWPSGVEDVRHEVATNQSIEIVEGEVTAVTSPASPGQPDRFELHGNFPNPFNGETIIEFSLPRAGQVQLTIFDVLGNIVYQATRVFTAGRHRFKWHGTGQDGAPLSTGFYFYSVATSGQRQMGKLLYLK